MLVAGKVDEELVNPNQAVDGLAGARNRFPAGAGDRGHDCLNPSVAPVRSGLIAWYEEVALEALDDTPWGNLGEEP